MSITPDVMNTGFHSIRLRHPPSGYRNIATNDHEISIVVTRDELDALEAEIHALKNKP